jgi:hypothetical protein
MCLNERYFKMYEGLFCKSKYLLLNHCKKWNYPKVSIDTRNLNMFYLKLNSLSDFEIVSKP